MSLPVTKDEFEFVHRMRNSWKSQLLLLVLFIWNEQQEIKGAGASPCLHCKANSLASIFIVHYKYASIFIVLMFHLHDMKLKLEDCGLCFTCFLLIRPSATPASLRGLCKTTPSARVSNITKVLKHFIKSIQKASGKV